MMLPVADGSRSDLADAEAQLLEAGLEFILVDSPERETESEDDELNRSLVVAEDLAAENGLPDLDFLEAGALSWLPQPEQLSTAPVLYLPEPAAEAASGGTQLRAGVVGVADGGEEADDCPHCAGGGGPGRGAGEGRYRVRKKRRNTSRQLSGSPSSATTVRGTFLPPVLPPVLTHDCPPEEK